MGRSNSFYILEVYGVKKQHLMRAISSAKIKHHGQGEQRVLPISPCAPRWKTTRERISRNLLLCNFCYIKGVK